MFANQLYDVLRQKGSLIQNAPLPKRRSLDQYFATRSSSRKCIYTVIFTIALVAILALALQGGGCVQDNAAGDVFRLVHTATEILLRGADLPSANADICRQLSFFCFFLSFFIQSFWVGLIAHVLSKAAADSKERPALIMSKKMVMRLRDGTCVLQTRYVSAQGHNLLDISARMTSYVIRRTEEGESFLETKALQSDTSNRAGCLPTSITHQMTASSPLFGLQTREYSVDVHIKAFDEQLGETVHGTYLYSSDDICVGYEWENPFIVTPKAILEDPTLVVTVDAGKISDTKELTPFLQQRLTAQMYTNRTAKVSALKNSRKGRDLDGRRASFSEDADNGSTGGGTLGGFARPVLAKSSSLYGDIVHGESAPVSSTSAYPERDVPRSLEDMSSPVSALTSPTYTPPPAMRPPKSANMSLFKMVSDADFAPNEGGKDRAEKKGKFSFFKK